MEYLNPADGGPLRLDRYSRLILKATRNDAKSAVELSERCNIPIAKCFRKIKRLERYGYLLETEKISTKEGKEVSLYRSDLDREFYKISSRSQVEA